MKGFCSRERRPKVGLPWDERNAPVDLDGPALAVEPEDLAAALCGVDEAEQQPDRRRLACTVGTEISDHLALCHVEVEVIEGGDVAIAFRQLLSAYGRRGHRAGVRRDLQLCAVPASNAVPAR